jgi:hypothetical protein
MGGIRVGQSMKHGLGFQQRCSSGGGRAGGVVNLGGQRPGFLRGGTSGWPTADAGGRHGAQRPGRENSHLGPVCK